MDVACCACMRGVGAKRIPRDGLKRRVCGRALLFEASASTFSDAVCCTLET
jgi:hypothetical protein